MTANLVIFRKKGDLNFKLVNPMLVLNYYREQKTVSSYSCFTPSHLDCPNGSQSETSA